MKSRWYNFAVNQYRIVKRDGACLIVLQATGPDAEQMRFSSIYKDHVELCERMATSAKSAEARKQWSDLAAELRSKAEGSDGQPATAAPADAKPAVMPSQDSDMERNGPGVPVHAEPPLSRSELSAASVPTPSEPSAESTKEPRELSDSRVQCAAEEALPTEQQLAQSKPSIPSSVEENGVLDPEWEELIAGIRSNRRPDGRG